MWENHGNSEWKRIQVWFTQFTLNFGKQNIFENDEMGEMIFLRGTIRLANATWFETCFGQQNHWIYMCLNPHKLMEKGSLKYGPHNMQICAAIPKVFKQRLCALTILGMLFLPHVCLRIPSRPIIGGACMPTNCPEKTFVTGMWLDDMCMPKSCWRQGSAD